jgi:predicted Rdx family selenoprotein
VDGNQTWRRKLDCIFAKSSVAKKSSRALVGPDHGFVRSSRYTYVKQIIEEFHAENAADVLAR